MSSVTSQLAELLDNVQIVFKGDKNRPNITSSDGKLFMNIWSNESKQWTHTEVTDGDLKDLENTKHLLKEEMRKLIKRSDPTRQ